MAIRKCELCRLILDGSAVEEALNEAAEVARREHQFYNQPLVVWRNNQVTYIDPFTDEIVPPPDYDSKPKACAAKRAPKTKGRAARKSA